MAAIAQKEKEKEDAKKREEEERRQRAEEAKNRRMNPANQRGPIRSSIPVKQEPVQMPSQSSDAAAARLNDVAMTELEDLFGEGL